MSSFKYSAKLMKKLLHFGSPAGMEMLLNFIAMFVMTLMLQSQGEAAATATTIMFNWDLVSFIPLLGIEIAVTSLVGRYMGAQRPQVAHRAALSAIKTGILYSVFTLILFLSIPEALVMVFQPDVPSEAFQQAIPMAIAMIRIAAIYVLAQACMVAMIGALRGAGDTFYTMLLSVTASWTFVPVVYVALYVLHLNVSWAWFAIVVVYMIFCAFIYRRFRAGKWKRIKVI
jgi:MATE family multidrug resistance protein